MHPFANLAVPAEQVAVHWFEQSSFAIKNTQGTIVLIDPYFPHERPADRFIHATAPVDEAQLPTDFVLLTHDHGDHTHPETIRRIWQSSPQARFVGPDESIRRITTEVGVPVAQTTTVRAGDTVTLGAITVHAVYAKPPAGDPAAGIKPPDVTHLGYVLKSGGRALYFTGDPINTFAEQDALIQAVAELKPELGFMTTHPSEGEFPFFAGCVKMAQRIGLKQVTPVHRACFVKRDYDANTWAAQFPATGPQPLIIAHNHHILYAGGGDKMKG